MNIFKHLSNLLFTKKTPQLTSEDQQSEYQPFLINRWCSMLNAETANIVNTTVNTMYRAFENKQDHYKFLHYILPRHRFTRINYIKKQKHEKPGVQTVTRFAQRLEISEREINLYKQQLNLDLTKYEPNNKKT